MFLHSIVAIGYMDALLTSFEFDKKNLLSFSSNLTAVILIINCSSVSLAARVQVIFTVCKLAALAMIVITGFVRLAQGKDPLNVLIGSFTEVAQIGLSRSILILLKSKFSVVLSSKVGLPEIVNLKPTPI